MNIALTNNMSLQNFRKIYRLTKIHGAIWNMHRQLNLV